MGFFDSPRPRAFAHRGWHTGDLTGCENSLAAFRRAVDEGYRYLETDVHLTSDGVLVAFHDTVLDRVTDARGAVADHSWAELRDVRIAGREPIPTMADLLERCPDAYFNIDAKSDATLGPLVDLLRESGADHRICLGSFASRRVRAARAALGPGIATSLGQSEIAANVLAVTVGIPVLGHGAVAAQVPTHFKRIPVVTEQFLARVHQAHLELHVWTINDAATMRRLLDLGVDGIMTDAPDVLRAVLDDRGQWHE